MSAGACLGRLFLLESSGIAQHRQVPEVPAPWAFPQILFPSSLTTPLLEGTVKSQRSSSKYFKWREGKSG